MRSAPARAASSNTTREPSTLVARVASLAERIANARWTTTSAPFTASRTLARSWTSPWWYWVFLQPASAGSNGLRAIPRTRATSRERSSAETSAIPRSPVGPVTVTVSPSAILVARLARQDDLCRLLLEHDPRHDGPHLPVPRGLERRPDGVELGELLEMLDGGEDQLEVALAMGLERLGRPKPAQVDALLAVAHRIGARRRLDHEEVGVEADLRLLRRDPAREGHERAAVWERQSGLLFQLAPAGLRRSAVRGVHGPAREHPRASHEALRRVALHEQHLGAGLGVAQNDHRGRRAGGADLPLVQLLAMGRAVGRHRPPAYSR